MSRQLVYLLLIFGLLVVPRALQRFSIPAPVTSLVLGIAAVFVFHDQVHDPVLELLSIIGISSLFLFAGLEVDLAALRKQLRPLLTHLIVRAIVLVGVGWLAWAFLGQGWQAAGLIALALLTPSTGFILESLERLGLDEEETFWVTNKAIAGEIAALAALFVILQAGDLGQLAVSSAAMIGVIIGVPLLFIGLGRWVVPHAPGSEFSLLVMVGLVAAFVTYSLGVYYLVGAFVVGLIARMLHERMPQLASDDNLHALRLFATFFVPMYFFVAGTHVPPSAFSPLGLGLGLLLTVVLLPLRIGLVWLQRRLLFGESSGSSMRVALALSPTLVFTLVLAGILHERFGLSDVMLGALLVYTILNTMLPSVLLRVPVDFNPLHRERGDPAKAGPDPAANPADAPGLDPRPRTIRNRPGADRTRWP